MVYKSISVLLGISVCARCLAVTNSGTKPTLSLPLVWLASASEGRFPGGATRCCISYPWLRSRRLTNNSVASHHNHVSLLAHQPAVGLGRAADPVPAPPMALR